MQARAVCEKSFTASLGTASNCGNQVAILSSNDIRCQRTVSYPHETISSTNAKLKPAMNIERARQQLGYQVEFPMEAAVRDYRDWLVGHPST